MREATWTGMLLPIFAVAGAVSAQTDRGHVFRSVALSGELAPGFPGGVRYSELDTAAISPFGAVGFRTTLQGPGVTGQNDLVVFGGLPGFLAAPIRESGKVPDALGFGTWSFFDHPFVAADGSLGLFTNYRNTLGQLRQAFVTAQPAEGIVDPVVTEIGDDRPPTPPGATVRWSTSSPSFAFTSSGLMLTAMNLEGPGFPSSSDIGMWVGTRGNLRTVATTQAPLPGGIEFITTSLGFGHVNNHGTVAFHAQSDTMVTIGGQPQRDQGVWLYAGDGVVEPVLRAGNAATGMPAGTLFAAPDNTGVSINDDGDIAFVGTFRSRPGPGPAAGNAIWAGDPNNLQVVASAGELAPGSGGDTFASFRGGVSISGSGRIAFHADTSASSPEFGLWRTDFLGETQLLALTNMQVPGEPEGVVFSNLSGRMFQNASEQIVFESQLTLFGTTINLGNAIFAAGADGETFTVARVGDEMELAPGDIRTITFLRLPDGTTSGGQDGLRSCLNDRGELVFTAYFEDGTHGIITTVIPAPGAAAVGGMLALASLRRSRRS